MSKSNRKAKKKKTGHDIPVLNYNGQKCHQLLFKPI